MLSNLFHVALQLVSRLRHDTKGAVAIIFGILLIPIVTATGAAFDYARVSKVWTAAQAVLDGALVAGARDGSSNWSQIAQRVFDGSNRPTHMGSLSAPSFSKGATAEVYQGSVSGSVPTVILGIVNISTMEFTVRATATAAEADDACILTLDHGQSAWHVSLSLNGAPVVNLSNCSIRSNTSIDCNGHDGGAPRAIAAGTASACSRPKSYAPIVPDIYAPLATNITKVCGSARPGLTWTPGVLPTGTAFKKVSKSGYTEYHVCGDLTLSGSGSLTGNAPGSDTVIVVENGTLTMASGADVSSLRTTIVLTGNNSYSSEIKFPQGAGQKATLTLSGSIDPANPWRGVALYQDPNLTYQVDHRWGPGATLNADGLVYLGSANVVTDGNTGSSNAKCSKFVMNSFVTNGAVDLNLNQSATACAALGMEQWGGIVVHLIQ
jgi:Flp pilus assembly protein TadG